MKWTKITAFLFCLFLVGFAQAQDDKDYTDLAEAQKEPQKVKRLMLSNKGLTAMPAEIFEMINLMALDLSGNQLKTLPADIKKLKKLNVLQIQNNQLTTLPAEIGELDTLGTLNAYNNQLKVLPTEIGKLKNLTDLLVQNNILKDLPTEIGNLSKLQRVDLSYNQFSKLPESFYKLKEVNSLNLYQNNFTDVPTKILTEMPALMGLFLNKNPIENTDFLLAFTEKPLGNDVQDLMKYLVSTKIEKLVKTAENVGKEKVKTLENTKASPDTLMAWYNLLAFAYQENNTPLKARDYAKKAIETAKKATETEKNVEVLKTVSKLKIEAEAMLSVAQKESQRLFLQTLAYLLGILVVVVSIIFAVYFYFSRKFLAEQKAKTDKLLLNILPQDVANELKTKGITTVRTFQKASILFADVKGFSKLAGKVTPQELIKELDLTFGKFDDIIAQYGLERVKTIGDCYMCVGGVPMPDVQNPVKVTLAALQIQKWMADEFKAREKRGEEFWEVRLGIHVGELVAGVIGKLKFAYDVWGNAVNTASRMESGGEVGRVNITGIMHAMVKDFFEFTHRGQIEAKNIGLVDTFFVDRIKPDFSADSAGFQPNEKFFELLNSKFPVSK
jgi:class 3 adenylate cyclase/Leucine-rich repeat (LRR) protein